MAGADSSLPSQTIASIATGWGNEGVYFYFENGAKVEGCASSTVRVNYDSLMLDRILSISLSAYHANIKVQFRISGCVGNDMKGIAVTLVNS